MFIDSTYYSDKFSLFIQHLIKWLETNNNFEFNEVIIIMDNWSIHKCANIKTLLKVSKITILYIPPYSPHLAPIEIYFGLFKKKLLSNSSKQMIKINSKDNYSKILDSFRGIKTLTIKIIFWRHYKVIQNHLRL